MKQYITLLIITVLLGAGAFMTPALHADPSSIENRLRDALRQARQETADAQAQLATLQTQKDAAEKERDVLKDDLKKTTDTLTAQVKSLTDDNTQLKQQLVQLQQQLDKEKKNNVTLINLASEILDRYEKYSLGEALAAKEPFTGLTRVKLENIAQDYQDKIHDLKIKSPLGGSTPPASAPPAPTPTDIPTPPSGTATNSATTPGTNSTPPNQATASPAAH